MSPSALAAMSDTIDLCTRSAPALCSRMAQPPPAAQSSPTLRGGIPRRGRGLRAMRSVRHRCITCAEVNNRQGTGNRPAGGNVHGEEKGETTAESTLVRPLGVVEITGLEPVTSGLQSRRSPS